MCANKLRRNEGRGARVMRNSKAAQDRRHACANAFRARLQDEVKDRGVVSEALIETCVSLHVQITELSRRFLGCRASGDEMVRLQIARGQFLRCLAALGLTNAAGEAEEPPAGTMTHETMEEIVAHFGASPKPQEGADGTPEPQ